MKIDILYYGLIKGLGIIFWLILLKLNACYLTPSQFGNFSISLNIAIIVAVLITGWQGSSFLRYYHENNNKLELYTILSNVMIKYIAITSFIWFVLSVIAYIFLNNEYFYILINSFLLSLSYAVFLLMITIFRIKRELKQYLIYTIIHSVVALLVYYFLIKIFSWQTGLISMSIGYIIVITIYLFSKKRNIFLSFKNKINYNYKNQLFIYGMPIVFIGISSQLLSTSDILILKYYGFSVDVGIYAANYNIAEKSIFAILSIMVAAFTPIVFKKSKEESFDVFIEIKKVLKLFLLVAIPLVIIMFFYSKDIAILFLNEKYLNGHYIIPFITLSGLFVGIASFYSEVLTIKKETKILAKLYLITTMFNIILNFIFIPAYGMLAAVISTVLSYLLLMILIFINAKRYHK